MKVKPNDKRRSKGKMTSKFCTESTMSKKQKKRFIAGAKCPSCQKLDTLMLFFENNVEKMECVACGYHQSQTDTDVKQAAKGSAEVIGLFKPE